MIEPIDFEAIKQQILPYFIQFYGIEFQDIIIKRFNQIEPIFYNTIDQISQTILEMKEYKKTELTLKFLTWNRMQLPENIQKQIILTNQTDLISSWEEIYNCLMACFQHTQYIPHCNNGIRLIPNTPTNQKDMISKSVTLLKQLGIKVTEQTFNTWIKSSEAKKIQQLKLYMDQLDNEYEQFIQQFIPWNTYIEKSSNYQKKLYEIYTIKFLNSIKNYLSNHDQQLLEQNKDLKKLNILNLVGHTIYQTPMIETFSTTFMQQLNNPSTSPFTKEFILKSQEQCQNWIKNYLLEEENAKKEWHKKPLFQIADEILFKKKTFYDCMQQEYLKTTSSYKMHVKQLEKLKLLSPFQLPIDYIKNQIICLIPNAILVDNKPIPHSLLIFSKKSTQGYADCSLIHEINHAIELNLLHTKKNQLIYKSGFEWISPQNKTPRNYKDISEIINQMIASEITEAMHQDGLYLFDHPLHSKTKNITTYEQQNCLVKPFFEAFKKEIIEARIDSNLDHFLNLIGKENFEQLNQIIQEHKILPYYTLQAQLIEKKDTEYTKKHKEYMQCAETILNNMLKQAKKIYIKKR